eukprot:8772314-Alexandrium_andersonii.AAC.1
MEAITSVQWGQDDFDGIQQFYIAWQARAWRVIAFMGRGMLKEMLLEQMGSSNVLSSLVEVYLCGSRGLQTYDTLIGMLEQWIDRGR